MDKFEKEFEKRYGDSEPMVKELLLQLLKEWYDLGQQEAIEQERKRIAAEVRKMPGWLYAPGIADRIEKDK